MAATIEANDLRPGMKVVVEGDLWVVQTFDLRTPGNLRSFVRSKMKRITDGAVNEFTFRGGNPTIYPADFEMKNCQFLFGDQDGYTFMDLTNYEQFVLPQEFLGFGANFLAPEAEVQVAFWNERPVTVELPPKMTFKITDTIGMVAKGNTANQITKEATIETGLKLQVPAFVNIGDKIRVSTTDGTYVDRATD